MFSRRSGTPRTQNALAGALAELDREALLDLTASNPTAVGLGGDLAPLATALEAGAAQRYTPEPFGLESGRRAVSAWLSRHGHAVPAERIVLTASTSEAYGFLFKLLCDPGDRVLVPRPSYPLFEHLARHEGVAVEGYPLRYDGRWHVDLPALHERVSERTRAIVVVQPNNPTGSLASGEELSAMAALGLPVIGDEVFAAYRHETSDAPHSVLQCDAPLRFSLSGLSKPAALPQAKLGWIAADGEPTPLSEALARLELIADSYLSVGPVQHALEPLLAGADAHGARIMTRLRENLASLDAALEGAPAVDRLHLSAGWYATLRLPAIQSDEAWALALLAGDRVLVQPGYFYDFDGGPFVVISLLTPPATFAEGVARLLRRVDSSI